MNGCSCKLDHPPRLVVVTGGPGAGKTALLDVVATSCCHHVVVLPEAATILWKGGFPRTDALPARRAAQRAIVGVQLELQRMAIDERRSCLIVCDRGTLDGLAYWPGDSDSYFAELRTTKAAELARYAAVIHMRPPSRTQGYVSTAYRPETPEQAADLDQRILQAWEGHPRRFVVPSNGHFMAKLERALALVREEIPPCCTR